MDLRKLKTLIELVESSGIAELEISEGEERVRITRTAASVMQTYAPAPHCTMLDRIILRPSDDVQGANMDGETVLLNVSTGRYYTLNRVGSVIWEHCTGHNSMSDIHALLCRRFD